MASEAPFPFLQQEQEAVESYDFMHGSMSRGEGGRWGNGMPAQAARGRAVLHCSRRWELAGARGRSGAAT